MQRGRHRAAALLGQYNLSAVVWMSLHNEVVHAAHRLPGAHADIAMVGTGATTTCNLLMRRECSSDGDT